MYNGVAGKLVVAGADCCVANSNLDNAFHLAALSGCDEAISHMLGLELEAPKEPVKEEVLLAVRTTGQIDSNALKILSNRDFSCFFCY